MSPQNIADRDGTLRLGGRVLTLGPLLYGTAYIHFLSRPEGVWLREALFFCFFSFP